jgi:hypothetical protein
VFVDPQLYKHALIYIFQELIFVFLSFFALLFFFPGRFFFFFSLLPLPINLLTWCLRGLLLAICRVLAQRVPFPIYRLLCFVVGTLLLYFERRAFVFVFVCVSALLSV